MTAEGYAAAAESEAKEEQAYQDFLSGLLDTKQYPLFAAYVSLDWLKSKEFANGEFSATEFIERKIKILEKIRKLEGELISSYGGPTKP